ncbi:MAG: hypothetical protein Q8930_10140 [Bacillota bacterium]|nr:hypothetical protein [Bacillota bacterium]
MKKMIIAAVLLSALIFTGCSGQGAKSTASTTSSSKQRVEVKTDFQPVKPNTVPALSEQQKSQVDSKLDSTLKDIDGTLKSLQDAPEIDLNSLDQ